MPNRSHRARTRNLAGRCRCQVPTRWKGSGSGWGSRSSSMGMMPSSMSSSMGISTISIDGDGEILGMIPISISTILDLPHSRPDLPSMTAEDPVSRPFSDRLALDGRPSSTIWDIESSNVSSDRDPGDHPRWADPGRDPGRPNPIPAIVCSQSYAARSTPRPPIKRNSKSGAFLAHTRTHAHTRERKKRK